MNPESQLPGLGLSEDADRIVSEGRQIPAPGAWHGVTSWRAVETKVLRRDRWKVRALVGFGLSGYLALALIAGALWVARRTTDTFAADGWREISLGNVGRLTLAPGTRVRLPTPEPKPDEAYRVSLDEGQLCADINHRDLSRQKPFEVDAPDLRVFVIGTRFCVFSGEWPSWVFVEQGRVEVRGLAEDGVSVGAGECIQADDHRLMASVSRPPVNEPTPPTPPAPSVQAIAPVAGAPQLRHGRGTLSQENALYESGLTAMDQKDGARSLAIWEDYRRRYPQGIFSTEADFYRLRELAAEGRAPVAVTALDEFTREHAGDWRIPEVQLVHADLLRLQLGQPLEALALYEQVAAGSEDASLGERALYGICQSVRALGRTVETRARLRQYLERFPDGPHRAEVERALAAQ